MLHRLPLATALAMLLAAVVAAAATAQAATSYSGQATALRASVLGVGATFADTGPLPASGGSQKASFVGVDLLGLLTADVLSASTMGRGNHSRSRASISDLALLGNLVDATALSSQAEAKCQNGVPQLSGQSQATDLVVNGQPIASVGLPNVTIPLVGGIMVMLNEQTSSTNGNYGQMTVNAVHVTGPGIDVVVASSEADVTCAQEPLP